MRSRGSSHGSRRLFRAGSTIGQQLVKALYTHDGGLGGTLEEIGLAVKLSLRYSKDRILNIHVLDQLVDTGRLSPAQADVALGEPWRLRRLADRPSKRDQIPP